MLKQIVAFQNLSLPDGKAGYDLESFTRLRYFLPACRQTGR